MNKAQKKD